jgi:hypothetical protein
MIIEAEQNHAAGGQAYSRQLAAAFLDQYQKLNQQLTIRYVNSIGQKVTLSFDDVSRRLFAMSFDPYHSIEYRWGAQGKELASSPDDATKKRFYQLEYRLRNQIERIYNQATPLSMGPEQPPAIDVCSWLIAYLQGKPVDTQIIAFNHEIIAPMPAMPATSTQLVQLPAQSIKNTAKNNVLEKTSENIDELEDSDRPQSSSGKDTPTRNLWDSLLDTGDMFAAAMVNPDNFVIANNDR